MMSKGEELRGKRRKLLTYLYDEGAIDPEGGAPTGNLEGAIGVSTRDLNALLWSLTTEEKTGVGGLGVFLRPSGFEEAAEIVKMDRSPMP